jgi:hypothetical protein
MKSNSPEITPVSYPKENPPRVPNIAKSRSGEVYSIQHYVIKFVGDLRQVGGFLHDSHDITEIMLKVSLNTITLTLIPCYITMFREHTYFFSGRTLIY